MAKPYGWLSAEWWNMFDGLIAEWKQQREEREWILCLCGNKVRRIYYWGHLAYSHRLDEPPADEV